MSIDEKSAEERVDAARYVLAARLIDSLLHDARNPLNALSINLEVLSEKLKLQNGGEVPASQEKNLKAMRDQIVRVDQILRLFAPFIGQGASGDQPVAISELVHKAAEVLAHESRRARVKVSVSVEPELRLSTRELAAVRLLCASVILGGIERCPAGGEVTVGLRREGSEALLEVTASGESLARGPLASGLLETAARLSGSLNESGRTIALVLPLA